MTTTPTLLGTGYDDPVNLPSSVDDRREKRLRAQREMERAAAAGQAEVAETMWWEMGLLDLVLAPDGDTSPYRGGEYDSYATHYHFRPETVAYARERAAETRDVVLRLSYLNYVLLQTPPRGRAWIDLQREILSAWREYVDGCRAGVRADARGYTVGVDIARALQGMERLLPRPGVVRGPEAEHWTEWILGLANDSRSFPTKPEESGWMRHRWVADFLVRLVTLPPEASNDATRQRALDIMMEAGQYFAADPLLEHFSRHVAEREAALRKHWGEPDTHRTMTRRIFDGLLRRAEFHAQTGEGGQLLASHWFREARRLAEEHRQYFGAAEISALEIAETRALERGIEGGEFKEMHMPVELPAEVVDALVGATPELTVDALVKHAVASVPDRAGIARSIEAANAGSPLLAMIPRSVIGPGKVVGESLTEEANLELDIEKAAAFETRVAGDVMVMAISRAATDVGLTGDHLTSPMNSLPLDVGSVAILHVGCERLVAGDHTSATHILILHIEDVFRQLLKSRGVDTTEFRQTDPMAGTSRTDDATLGALLRKTLPDGRTVRAFLGDDVWLLLDSALNSQTGLNLRNDFAHGLARQEHVAAGISGIALSLLYLLSEVARGQ